MREDRDGVEMVMGKRLTDAEQLRRADCDSIQTSNSHASVSSRPYAVPGPTASAMDEWIRR